MLFLQGLRVAFVFCLYFLTLACFLMPVLILKYWGSETLLISSPNRSLRNRELGLRCISFCNCAAAGIFLSMCFLGLIPYVEEKFHLIMENLEYTMQFPLTECIVVLGFFITLIIEQSLYCWQERREACLQEDLEQGQGLLEECEMQDLSDDPSVIEEDHQNLSIVEEEQSQVTTNTNHTSHSEENHSDDGETITVSNEAQLEHGRKHFSLLMYKVGTFPFFVLACATSLHSVFEGIALGLQTDISKAVHIFIAIIIHECLVALALGVNSTRLRYTFTSYLKFAVIYSAAIPVGLLIGIAIEHSPVINNEICSGVLQGIAAGIFLHVVFQDILPSEFSNRQDRLLKVLFLFIGFSVIAVITFFISEF